MNIYQRRDGRFEGRISRGKRSNGTRRFQYFFGKTKEAVREKMAKERRKKSNCSLTDHATFQRVASKHTAQGQGVNGGKLLYES